MQGRKEKQLKGGDSVQTKRPCPYLLRSRAACQKTTDESIRDKFILQADDFTITEKEFEGTRFSFRNGLLLFAGVPHTGLFYAWKTIYGIIRVQNSPPQRHESEALFAYKDGKRILNFRLEYWSGDGPIKTIFLIDQNNEGIIMHCVRLHYVSVNMFLSSSCTEVNIPTCSGSDQYSRYIMLANELADYIQTPSKGWTVVRHDGRSGIVFPFLCK